MKVVVNKCFGGFGLSSLAKAELGVQYKSDIPRNDPKLVEVVERLGSKANDLCAELHVIEIPDDVEWQVEEYDGMEHIAEKHRTWH